MKSIREKAKELLDFPYIQDTFEEGANYVLDAIEDIIVNNEDNTLNMAKCLVDCIKQLKSNQ